MEVEMLQAMFTDDFKLASAAPLASFHIDLFPEASGADDGNHVAAELHVAYTPSYPEDAPTLRIVPKLGLSDALAAKVTAQLVAAIADLRGAPMIWSLAEAVQQFLREHNTPAALSAYDEMMLRQAAGGEAGGAVVGSTAASDDDEYAGAESRAAKRAAEYVDERRVHPTYTAVTPENFLQWRTAFLARTVPTGAEVELSSKPTGRQLFASGDMELAIENAARGEGGDDDDDVEDADYTRHSEEEEAAGAEEGAIDESLFDDED